MSTNTRLAELFAHMADVLELLGANRFKVAAYQRGARALEELSEDAADIAEIPRLTSITGIGKGLAEKIIEYVETGSIEEIEQALDEVPPGVRELLHIPGLGPKTILVLWKQGAVDSLDTLKEKIESGALADLPRMGQKTIDKIAKSIAFAESTGGRIRVDEAMGIAVGFMQAMRDVQSVRQAEYTGSLRRGRETIGDIDILVACDDPDKQGPEVSDAFRSMSAVHEVIAAGKTKVSVRTAHGVQVDLRIVRSDQYGAALMYFTGSKEHNVAMRERALKRGMSLNEYGLTRTEDKGASVAADTERDIYEALDLRFIPPELREARGEIDSADKHQLPKLVEIADIKAELHAHTIASDGSWTIEELASAARSRGFHTVAVTDHSASSVIANGLSAQRLERHIEAIHEANKKVKGINILAGSEVDILADGKLDYPDDLLAALDLVVASPHAALTQKPDRATKRLIAAVENPFVHILGHPTGRLINRREGLSPNMSALYQAAAASGTALEINASPFRLDLRDVHARSAIEAGALLAINTDAHGPDNLDLLFYGLLTARRAWVEARHVINCMSAPELERWLKAKR